MASEGEHTPISRFNARWSSAIPMSPVGSLQSRHSTDYQPVAIDAARRDQHTTPLLQSQNESMEEYSPTGASNHSSHEIDDDGESSTTQTVSAAFDKPLAWGKETDQPNCDQTEDQEESSELIDPFRDPWTKIPAVHSEEYAPDTKMPINEYLPSGIPVNSRLLVRDAGNLPPKGFTEAPRRKQYAHHFWFAAAASIVFAIPLPIFFMIQRDTSNSQQDFASGIVRGARSYCDVVNAGRPDGIEGLLAINAAYGDMTFALAKFIDIVWDICVGRGYQLVFLVISYRVFTDCLLLIMESATVPYDLYTNLGFEKPSLFTLPPIVRFAFGRSTWRHKCLMIWLVLSILWTALLPTFLSAMTGYVPNNNTLAILLSKTVLTDSGYAFNTEYLEEQDFRDAQVGYSATVCMTNGGDRYPFLITQNQSAATANYGDYESGSLSAFSWDSFPQNGTVIEAHDLWEQLNQTFTDNVLNWGNVSQAYSYAPTELLPSNISTAIFNFNCTDGYQPIVQQPGVDYYYGDDRNLSYFEPLYIIDSVGYPFNWLFYMQNVMCYNNNRYQWGFSYYMLLIWVIMNAIWTAGTYILWIYINQSKGSQLSKTSGRLGKYRAALDISEAIRDELGPDTCAYTNQELEDNLKNRPPVRYVIQKTNRHKSQTSVRHFGISSTQSREPIDLRPDQLYGRYTG